MPLQTVHGCGMHMKFLLMFYILYIAAATSCKRRCGNVEVPFPFGLDDDGPSCYYPDRNSFLLKCNATYHPPKLFLGKYEVIDIGISKGKMRILQKPAYGCYDDSGVTSGSTPLFGTIDGTQTFSYTDNIYTGVGCNTAVMVVLNSNNITGRFSRFNYSAGCLAMCTSMDEISDGQCSGSGCCQMSIRKNLQLYRTDIGSYGPRDDVLDISPCSYSFLVEKGNYTFHSSDLKNMSTSREFSVVLDWFVGNQTCEVASANRSSYLCVSNHSHCSNSTNGPGYICQCSLGFQGNPYVLNGCQDINECEIPKSCHSAAVCSNTPGNYSCICPAGTTGDPYISGCVKVPRKLSVLLVSIIGACSGVAIGLICISALKMRKRFEKKRVQHQRRQCFKKNREILL